MLHPTKGQKALRRGRHSVDGASYFLTVCTEGRGNGLENPELTTALLNFARSTDNLWISRSVVVMPDHLHLLVELKASINLSDAIRLFKGRTAALLRSHRLKWQRGYFDHCLRVSEDALPIFLYLFLNPYRANLLTIGQAGPVIFAFLRTGSGSSRSRKVHCRFLRGWNPDRGVKPLLQPDNAAPVG